jgi:cell division protein FtsI/penicillin-binding protein 2
MGAHITTKRRIQLALAFWTLCFAGLVGRLVQIQAVARAPQRRATSLKRVSLPPHRGSLLTRAGSRLAVTEDLFDVTADPCKLLDRAGAAQKLAELLQLSYEEIYNKLSKTTQKKRLETGEIKQVANHYVLLKRSIGKSLAQKVHEESLSLKNEKGQPLLQGIELRDKPTRRYPKGRFAAQLVGYLNDQGQGFEGLEFGVNKELAGIPGSVETKRDAKKRPIPGDWHQVVPPVDGYDIVLTMDEQIQLITEAALAVAQKKYNPSWICAIVMRPRTGEVLAMSTKPDFDPNHLPPNIGGLAVNRAVRFAYEPGSTFKLITAAAAIERIPTWDVEKYYCEGIRRISKFPVRCWIYNLKHRGHGSGTLSDSIKNSCNLVICRFAQQMGGESLLEYIRNFGFGERTGVGLPREARGLVPKRIDRKDPAHLASLSFGQSIMVTPVQLLTAVCAIANDGMMMQPHIVREIRTPEGEVVQRFEPKAVRQVIQRSTARLVTSFMMRVVKEGTGKPAAVSGYEVAGKTGTAQKVKGGTGAYSSSAFISSFIGFLPARKPELAILVVADEPQKRHYGSEVCAPVFQQIAEKSMIKLRMTNDQ